MTLFIITPPAAPVIPTAEARAYLRAESADDDVITSLVAGVTDWLAGPQGWLGVSLVNQTIELRLDAFPCRAEGIRLLRPPLVEVVSVTYVDDAGAPQSWSTDLYETIPAADGLPRLCPVHGENWPSPARDIRVRYTAGYGAAGTDVAAGIRMAILRYVASAWSYRDGVEPGGLRNTLRADLSPYRVFS